MAKKLFVGGLPYSVTDSKLEEMFAEIGTVVSAVVIIDWMTSQSKGFGFVEMENDKDADEAIKKLNDTEVDGRSIIVNVARPKTERPKFGSGGGGGGGGSRRGPRRF